jgi:hypothetical protein
MAVFTGGLETWGRRDQETTSIEVVDQLSSAPLAADSEPQVVSTEGGSVTLLDLASLRARTDARQNEATKAAQEASSLRALAEGLWAQVGERLMASRDKWSPTEEAAEPTRQATSLSEQIAKDDADLESRHAKEHGGLSGLAFKVGGWNETRRLSEERAHLESQRRTLLARVARLSPQAQLNDVGPLRDQAGAAESQALELEKQAALASTAATGAAEEVKRRSDAERELGFDGPYLAARLKTYGPQDVESPLILKRGERACWVAPASLARNQTRRQWVGGSQGFSFPIGHTGIRYRVGAFHGHPIEQQSLTKLDSGSVVITNQRIAFIGRTKSTSVPLAKLLHVECYSDGVAVFQEGRENPDYYLTAQPKYGLFMINWFLNQAAS